MDVCLARCYSSNRLSLHCSTSSTSFPFKRQCTCRPTKLSRQVISLGTFDCILNRHCQKNVPVAMKPLFCPRTRSHICDVAIAPRRRAPGYCNHGVRPAQNPMTIHTNDMEDTQSKCSTSALVKSTHMSGPMFAPYGWRDLVSFRFSIAPCMY